MALEAMSQYLELTTTHGHFRYRSCEHAALAAENTLQKIIEKSRVVDSIKFDSLPRFNREDRLRLGNLLGSGEFSHVYEIRSVATKTTAKKTNDPYDSDDSSVEDLQMPSRFTSVKNAPLSKEFIADHCVKEGSDKAKYAIKYLKKDIMMDRYRFSQGAVDILTEALYLSSLNHPNIIRIRGVSSAGVADFKTKERNFFIIIDRLYDTLDQRLGTWTTTNRKLSFKKILDPKGGKLKAFLAHRLKVAYDLASAMAYLHDKNIMHRDLKPENIGFDERGNVKLFDFGLVRELNPRYKMANGTYKLSGNTGSRYYMAPEVAKNEPYNLTADVYSFAILLWEIFSLKKPFEGYDFKRHEKLVVHGGTRPKISKTLAPPLTNLFQKCWSENIYDRLSFPSMMMILKSEIIELRDGNEEGFNNFRRGSKNLKYDNCRVLAA